MFLVDSLKAVSTWSEPCQLKIYQLLNEDKGVYQTLNFFVPIKVFSFLVLRLGETKHKQNGCLTQE